MSDAMLQDFTTRLLEGTLRHEEIFDSKGHGAFYPDAESSRPSGEGIGQRGIPTSQQDSVRPEPVEGREWARREGLRRTMPRPSGRGASPSHPPFIAVTGPQRGRLRDSTLNPYFAAPHGDMMLSGCFGMLRAFAHRFPQHAEEIDRALNA
jgi:hypothetical protein